MVYTLRHNVGVEHNRTDVGKQAFYGFVGKKRQVQMRVNITLRGYVVGCSQHHVAEISLGKIRLKLLATIMMVYAIREPHTLEINRESTELVVIALATIVYIYSLKGATYTQIVTAKLVGGYVATAKRGLG